MIVLRFDGLYRSLSNGIHKDANCPEEHQSGEPAKNGCYDPHAAQSSPTRKNAKDRPSSRAGILCYGWLITRKGVVIAQGHGAFARSRNANSNVAEYLALIEGLDALLDLGVGNEAVEVRGDAKSIIDQMRGSAEVNAASIRSYYRQAQRLVSRLRRVDWVWMPRKNNREADTLSRRAMRQLRRDRSYYQSAVQSVTTHRRGRDRQAPVLDLRIYY